MQFISKSLDTAMSKYVRVLVLVISYLTENELTSDFLKPN